MYTMFLQRVLRVGYCEVILHFDKVKGVLNYSFTQFLLSGNLIDWNFVFV